MFNINNINDINTINKPKRKRKLIYADTLLRKKTILYIPL